MYFKSGLITPLEVVSFFHSLIPIHSFIFIGQLILITISFSHVPQIAKNCIKWVAFLQKYTHKIILNLQELWPRTVFTFYNGKGCVGGGKSVLKINSMTWKINRQKQNLLGKSNTLDSLFWIRRSIAARFQQSPAILDGIAFVWLDN